MFKLTIYDLKHCTSTEYLQKYLLLVTEQWIPKLVKIYTFIVKFIYNRNDLFKVKKIQYSLKIEIYTVN